MKNIPRSIQLDKMTPAEKAIREAMMIVEEMGSDVKLTQAIIHLQDAQKCVADFVDGIK